MIMPVTAVRTQYAAETAELDHAKRDKRVMQRAEMSGYSLQEVILLIGFQTQPKNEDAGLALVTGKTPLFQG